MINSIDRTQEKILETLREELAQPVYEESIPDGTSIRRNANGQIDPYIAVQFGDVYARGARSMIGQRGHDYSMPLAVQVISPEPTMGRKLSNRIMSLLLGREFEFAPGGIEKMPVGGAITTLNQSDAASQVYMIPSWYRVVIHFHG